MTILWQMGYITWCRIRLPGFSAHVQCALHYQYIICKQGGDIPVGLDCSTATRIYLWVVKLLGIFTQEFAHSNKRL